MSTRQDAVTSVESSLARVRKAFADGYLNISRTEVDKARYKQDLAQTSWTQFVQSADYLYFVARTMLAQDVALHGLFCAQQCVENYLKAALAAAGLAIPQTHSLPQLLNAAKQHTPYGNSVLHSTHIETICLRFNPFYELGRYPAHLSRPANSTYVAIPAEDLLYLDYFIFQMRQMLPLPSDEWDILGRLGHRELQLVRERQPALYSLFTRGNLNFLPVTA